VNVLDNSDLGIGLRRAQQVELKLFRFMGSSFEWSRWFRNSSRVSLGGKVLVFIYLDLFFIGFLHSMFDFLEDMTDSN